jgi:hypothetical protein
MPDRPLGVISVSNRTIDLAGEILVIAQIVRLRELDFEVRKGFSPGRTTAIAAAVFVAIFGSAVFGTSGRGAVTIIASLVALGIVLYCVIPTTRYILAIELASGSINGLSSGAPAALTHLKETIRQVIENPPLQPMKFHVGDVYSVDARGSRGFQFGSGNSQFSA